ncbi:MAG: AMP-binding protein [Moraxellaceae bacterium]
MTSQHDPHNTPALPWHAAYQRAGISPELPAKRFRNLADLVSQSSQTYADQQAFTCVVPNGMNGSLSFTQIDQLSDAFAGYLRETLGLPKGSSIAIQLPNSLSYAVAAFGIIKACCVLVNTNPLYTTAEMIHQFIDADVKALVIVDMFADKLPEVMAATGLEHVIVAGVPEFFPKIPQTIVRGVQKIWSKVLPPITVPHVRLQLALYQGRQTLGTGDAKIYWEHISGEQVAVLQYTGGTTGVSKGAMLTHDNILINIQQMFAMTGSHMEEGTECVLTALPLYHIFAFMVNLLGFYSIGARNILIPSPRPIQNLQRAIENYPITWFTGVNTLYNALLNEEWFVAYPPKTLKASVAGGTALHQAVAKRWQAVTNTPIAEGYGLTETSPVVSFNPLGAAAKAGTIGIPAPHTQIRLVLENGQPAAVGEAGELLIKGPQVMKGYWQRPDETALAIQDGWLATGDIAVMDEEGYFKIVDRKKDMILVSGFNVYPNEVEDAIGMLDSVLEVAVVGLPDTKSGEAVRAYVVKNPEFEGELNPQTIIEHCRTVLTGYKIPKEIVFRDDLPKSPIGKILRKDLKAEIKAEFSAKAS